MSAAFLLAIKPKHTEKYKIQIKHLTNAYNDNIIVRHSERGHNLISRGRAVGSSSGS